VACITLTRIPLTRDFTLLPPMGWEIAYEGQIIATYAEEEDGWLQQIRSSPLDLSLRGHANTWRPAKGFPSLDALRDAYVLRAKAWEEQRAGISH
jgi:hypothetical protein